MTKDEYLVKQVVSRTSDFWFLSKYLLYFSCYFVLLFFTGYFSLMYFLNKKLLTKINLWIAAIIHRLVFNFNRYFLTFLNGTCLSSNPFNRKLSKEWLTLFFNIKNKISVYFKIVQYNIFFIEMWPTSFIDIGFGWGRVWKNWWHDPELG